jgi:integrase
MTLIRMQYVKQYRDRSGKLRYYLRHPKSPSIPLPGPPGSRQFMAAYEAGLVAPETKKGQHRDGTIGALVTGFYQSSGFKNLAPSSQQRYRLVLDKFAQKDGHRLVRDMPRRVAVSIIEEIGETTPGMANLSASVMRRLFAYAIGKELRKDNPFAGIEPYKLGSHHTWSEAEIATYRAAWPLGTRERLAFDLLLYTGQRVGDVAAMRRSDLRDGVIRITTEKTGAELDIPLHADLLRSILPRARSEPDWHVAWSADFDEGVVGDGHTRRSRGRVAEEMPASRIAQERHEALGRVRVDEQGNRLD